jgi:hypothetical protein
MDSKNNKCARKSFSGIPGTIDKGDRVVNYSVFWYSRNDRRRRS